MGNNESSLVIKTKASQSQLEELHGDLHDIYKNHLERLKESSSSFKIVYLSMSDYDKLKDMINIYEDTLEPDDIALLRGLIGMTICPINKDDIALMRNIQTFLKENEIHSDFRKKSSLASLGKAVMKVLEDKNDG